MSASIQDVLDGRERWCLLQGDCLEVLPTMADKSVAHVITDPPYNARTHARARSLKDGGSDIPIDFAPLASFSFVLDLLRVSARWVVAFCAVEQIGNYSTAAGDAAWIRAGIWNRPDGTPQLSADRPGQGAEGIAIMHRAGAKRWNSGGKRGLWTCGVERVDRNHPTPKPVSLMVELISDFTDPDDIILDPFAGSGTTGVACLRLGRRFIGIEKSPEYARIATERLAAEENGLSLRDVRHGQLPMFGAGK